MSRLPRVDQRSRGCGRRLYQCVLVQCSRAGCKAAGVRGDVQGDCIARLRPAKQRLGPPPPKPHHHPLRLCCISAAPLCSRHVAFLEACFQRSPKMIQHSAHCFCFPQSLAHPVVLMQGTSLLGWWGGEGGAYKSCFLTILLLYVIVVQPNCTDPAQ